MRPNIFFWLLIACLGVWIYTLLRQRRSIKRLERSQEEIQVEETMVFDFLHGLGEAFSETIRPADLHRLIVEGAMRVLDAQGGALYLNDRTGTKLVPTFVSKTCPPLVDVPPHILQQSAAALYNAIIYSEANEKKRLDHDLEIARDIQRILLPAEAPKVDGFEISGVNVPARQVSGDYFDYIKIDEERLGVAIADVSGKGVPASLIMAICRRVLRSQAMGNSSPTDVLQKVNRQLYPDIKEDMFISMAYLVLDHARGTVTLARAGHDAPLLYQAKNKTVTPLKTPGMVVGIDSGDVI